MEIRKIPNENIDRYAARVVEFVKDRCQMGPGVWKSSSMEIIQSQLQELSGGVHRGSADAIFTYAGLIQLACQYLENRGLNRQESDLYQQVQTDLLAYENNNPTVRGITEIVDGSAAYYVHMGMQYLNMFTSEYDSHHRQW